MSFAQSCGKNYTPYALQIYAQYIFSRYLKRKFFRRGKNSLNNHVQLQKIKDLRGKSFWLGQAIRPAARSDCIGQ
jgi:hypothetical protein